MGGDAVSGRHTSRGKPTPAGWERVAAGLWAYASGATVEDVGSGARYVATDPDGVRVRCCTRAEAMAWVMGVDADEEERVAG